jgi:hypothetical protein
MSFVAAQDPQLETGQVARALGALERNGQPFRQLARAQGDRHEHSGGRRAAQ